MDDSLRAAIESDIHQLLGDPSIGDYMNNVEALDHLLGGDVAAVREVWSQLIDEAREVASDEALH